MGTRGNHSWKTFVRLGASFCRSCTANTARRCRNINLGGRVRHRQERGAAGAHNVAGREQHLCPRGDSRRRMRPVPETSGRSRGNGRPREPPRSDQAHQCNHVDHRDPRCRCRAGIGTLHPRIRPWPGGQGPTLGQRPLREASQPQRYPQSARVGPSRTTSHRNRYQQHRRTSWRHKGADHREPVDL